MNSWGRMYAIAAAGIAVIVGVAYVVMLWLMGEAF